MKITSTGFFVRLLSVFVLILIFPAPVLAQQAATYYVSPQGNDSNAGTQAQPWKTVIYAVKQVKAGDTILVADGTYQGPVIITRSGEPGAYITLKSINPLGAKIEVSNGMGKADGIKAAANYLTIDGFEIYDKSPGNGHLGNGVTVYENHHVNILNNEIHGFGGSGIQAGRFDYVHIENNTVYNNAKYDPNQKSGISLWQARAVDNAPGYHIIVRHNRSYGNINLVPNSQGRTTDGNGILVDNFWNEGATNVTYPHRTLVENNLSYDNGGKGIQVFKSSYVDLFNNTAYHNNHDLQSESTWRAELSHAFADETVWRNNIGVAKPGAGVLQWNRAILIGRGGDTVWENNITYSGTPGDLSLMLDNGTITEAELRANNIMGRNPLFADPGNEDFSLLPESPAVDAGSDDIESFLDINYLERPEGSVDIGAFEFGDSGQPVDVTSPETELPAEILLDQNYPNPFSRQTSISYTLQSDDHVTLEVFDVLGRRVRTLVDNTQAAGTYSVGFDARQLPYGTYMYKLTTESSTKTKKMILMK